MLHQTTGHQNNLFNNSLFAIKNPRRAKTTLHHTGRVEVHTSNQKARRLGKRQAIGNSPRRNTEARNSSTTARHPNSGTPRQRRNLHPSLSLVLVARDANLDHRLRGGMRNMPAKQEYHPPSAHSSLSHPHFGRRTPIPANSLGPHHRT